MVLVFINGKIVHPLINTSLDDYYTCYFMYPGNNIWFFLVFMILISILYVRVIYQVREDHHEASI